MEIFTHRIDLSNNIEGLFGVLGAPQKFSFVAFRAMSLRGLGQVRCKQ